MQTLPPWRVSRAAKLARVGCWAAVANRELSDLRHQRREPEIGNGRRVRALSPAEWAKIIEGGRLAQPSLIKRINEDLVDAPTVEQHVCWLILDDQTSLAKSEAVRASSTGKALVNGLLETMATFGRRQTVSLPHPLDGIAALCAEIRLAKKSGDSTLAFDCSVLLAREVVYLSLVPDFRIPYSLIWRAAQIGVLTNLGHPHYRASPGDTCLEAFVEALHARWFAIRRLAAFEVLSDPGVDTNSPFAIALFEPMVHLLTTPSEAAGARLGRAIRCSDPSNTLPSPSYAKFHTQGMFEVLSPGRSSG